VIDFVAARSWFGERGFLHAAGNALEQFQASMRLCFGNAAVR
jgi:hypothetical protein